MKLIKAIIRSKAMWFSFILGVTGLLEQSSGILSAIIGQERFGILLFVAGIISAAIRSFTNSPLMGSTLPKE